jgi:GDP-D-mannose dehydratase
VTRTANRPRTITQGLARVSQGLQDCVLLGNLDVTGEKRTVREFVQAAADESGMDGLWRGANLDETGESRAGRIVVRVSKGFADPRTWTPSPATRPWRASVRGGSPERPSGK